VLQHVRGRDSIRQLNKLVDRRWRPPTLEVTPDLTLRAAATREREMRVLPLHNHIENRFFRDDDWRLRLVAHGGPILLALGRRFHVRFMRA
jgi:hypothetical protein